ncbi:MAG: hypothetical protein VXZ73_00785 [Pseudomonadota bacterium]|nr:hypothetical protein [Pseudomonadota bacterium]
MNLIRDLARATRPGANQATQLTDVDVAQFLKGFCSALPIKDLDESIENLFVNPVLYEILNDLAEAESKDKEEIAAIFKNQSNSRFPMIRIVSFLCFDKNNKLLDELKRKTKSVVSKKAISFVRELVKDIQRTSDTDTPHTNASNHFQQSEDNRSFKLGQGAYQTLKRSYRQQVQKEKIQRGRRRSLLPCSFRPEKS